MHPRQPIPRLWMMTDERQGKGLLPAVKRLPRGAGIVFRHYSLPPRERRALFEAVRRAARGRLVLVLAGSARQAAAWRADGWHGPATARASRPMPHSASAHNAREVRRAADILFLSPLFPTRSHPGGRVLGRTRFAALARQARVPVIALGGMTPRNARRLGALGASGWAAIDGLIR
ncbi:thiamine phosphate synthase [Sphingomonas sp. ID0503]|uniref:thiamine phosphate synthase n=1 Tax=Sphingomonas sp. ID0503 TaxID=3399691 RepID=UPI003AFB0DEE